MENWYMGVVSGRRCRAMESDPLHCDLIVRRWEQFTGEKAEKIET